MRISSLARSPTSSLKPEPEATDASVRPAAQRPAAEAQPYVVYSAEAGRAGRVKEAAADIYRSVRQTQLWSSLALQDIAARYRGSILGPWWITLTMGALITGMSLLYSQLMHLSLEEYVPFMSCGIVIWGFINACVAEGCDSFSGAAPIIKQTALPLFTFVMRTLARNLLVLGHNLIIIASVAVIFGFWREVRPLELLGGTAILGLNLLWIITLAALASARFRDVPQIVVAVLQVALFITPVFWRPDQLKGRPMILVYNPFYHLMELVRAPLVGMPHSFHSWSIGLIMAAIGWGIAFPLFAYNRRRLVHYL